MAGLYIHCPALAARAGTASSVSGLFAICVYSCFFFFFSLATADEDMASSEDEGYLGLEREAGMHLTFGVGLIIRTLPGAPCSLLDPAGVSHPFRGGNVGMAFLSAASGFIACVRDLMGGGMMNQIGF